MTVQYAMNAKDQSRHCDSVPSNFDGRPKVLASNGVSAVGIASDLEIKQHIISTNISL